MNTSALYTAKKLRYKLLASVMISTLTPCLLFSLLMIFNSDTAGNKDWVIFAVGIFISFLVSFGIFIFLNRRISKPLDHIRHIFYQSISGNTDARADLHSRDEIEEIGNALNEILDIHAKHIQSIATENDKLNESVIQLMEATAQLSDKDLTVKIPVREDVTGAVADAMNMMVQETASVLRQIKMVACDVREAADMVKTQGDKVSSMAAAERSTIEETRHELKKSASAMSEVATMAQSTTSIAFKATQSTEQALVTVIRSVGSMQEIREIISETEKRIKRLGERSQEITGAVEIINSIAERTNVLALNASMQAAAAGEAGRSFAVVADEVQRLAESSRNSTSQIATLVKNIQSETSETMAAMNRTIEQVIAGSNQVEDAGKQMKDTKSNTAELVSMVEDISKNAIRQAKAVNHLLEYAEDIHSSTQNTAQELLEQTAQTDNLTLFANTLLDSVDVFKLPGEEIRKS